MTSITAANPLLALADPVPSRPPGAGEAGAELFAPVLAALLAPSITVPAGKCETLAPGTDLPPAGMAVPLSDEPLFEDADAALLPKPEATAPRSARFAELAIGPRSAMSPAVNDHASVTLSVDTPGPKNLTVTADPGAHEVAIPPGVVPTISPPLAAASTLPPPADRAASSVMPAPGTTIVSAPTPAGGNITATPRGQSAPGGANNAISDLSAGAPLSAPAPAEERRVPIPHPDRAPIDPVAQQTTGPARDPASVKDTPDAKPAPNAGGDHERPQHSGASVRGGDAQLSPVGIPSPAPAPAFVVRNQAASPGPVASTPAPATTAPTPVPTPMATLPDGPAPPPVGASVPPSAPAPAPAPARTISPPSLDRASLAALANSTTGVAPATPPITLSTLAVPTRPGRESAFAAASQNVPAAALVTPGAAPVRLPAGASIAATGSIIAPLVTSTTAPSTMSAEAPILDPASITGSLPQPASGMTASVTPPPPSSAPTAPVAVGAGPAAGDPQSNSQTGAQTGSQPDAQTNTAPRSEPVPQPRGPAAILPALQAFGAALHRAVVAERRQVLHDGDAIPILSAPISSAFATPAVASSTAPLDTAQPRWPEAMVTRIEQLRDLATVPGSSADTRIRLLPDALGPVEIVLRRDGDAVHVQLTAADQATRTLLADAQPRLVELAETKGLRLAMQADGGPAGQGDRRPPAPAPTQPPRPASVRTDADADSADPHLRLA